MPVRKAGPGGGARLVTSQRTGGWGQVWRKGADSIGDSRAAGTAARCGCRTNTVVNVLHCWAARHELVVLRPP